MNPFTGCKSPNLANLHPMLIVVTFRSVAWLMIRRQFIFKPQFSLCRSSNYRIMLHKAREWGRFHCQRPPQIRKFGVAQPKIYRASLPSTLIATPQLKTYLQFGPYKSSHWRSLSFYGVIATNCPSITTTHRQRRSIRWRSCGCHHGAMPR